MRDKIIAEEKNTSKKSLPSLEKCTTSAFDMVWEFEMERSLTSSHTNECLLVKLIVTTLGMEMD